MIAHRPASEPKSSADQARLRSITCTECRKTALLRLPPKSLMERRHLAAEIGWSAGRRSVNLCCDCLDVAAPTHEDPTERASLVRPSEYWDTCHRVCQRQLGAIRYAELLGVPVAKVRGAHPPAKCRVAVERLYALILFRAHDLTQDDVEQLVDDTPEIPLHVRATMGLGSAAVLAMTEG